MNSQRNLAAAMRAHAHGIYGVIEVDRGWCLSALPVW
jgi:hypothetical protein